MTRYLQPLAASVAVLVACASGCQQKMADQPSYRPYQPSNFFPKGTSAQKIPAGAMAREWLRSDDPLMTGLKPDARHAHGPVDPRTGVSPPPDSPSDPGKFVDTYPFELTETDVLQGQQSFTIFCAICHDPLGTGNGKVPERSYVKPPNFHTDDSRGFSLYRKSIPLREAPVGYIYEVVRRGYGAMPRYGPQVPPRDRWKIVAYVRSLQLSQHAELAALAPAERKAAEDALGGKP
jgi:mono/diheme cytochrome c family protein